MPKFHLMNSALGGMGKSLLCQVMIHIHEKSALPYITFDADVELLKVHELYPETTQPLKISEVEFKNTDAVYRSMEAGKTILVNLPASSTVALEKWFRRDRLFKVAQALASKKKSIRYRFVNWFLSDGSPGSLAKFQESVSTYGDSMVHVLVQNLSKRPLEGWGRTFQDDRLRSLLDLEHILTVHFPPFIKPSGWDEMGLTFAEAISCRGVNGEALHLLDRQRVASFVRVTEQNLQMTGLLDKATGAISSQPLPSPSRQAIDFLLTH